MAEILHKYPMQSHAVPIRIDIFGIFQPYSKVKMLFMAEISATYTT